MAVISPTGWKPRSHGAAGHRGPRFAAPIASIRLACTNSARGTTDGEAAAGPSKVPDAYFLSAKRPPFGYVQPRNILIAAVGWK
jgi:hypothetical protein